MTALVEHEEPRATVCLTFDLDADWGTHARDLDRRLSTRSEGRFAIRRALPRILELLADRDILATFFVPGEIAERYPEAVRAVLDGGHEVAHHGHRHDFADLLSNEDQESELTRALAVLGDAIGRPPRGYRAPGWELTPYTLGRLLDLGLAYDSSLMEDDRPYVVTEGGRSLIEVPVHWSLDDYAYFGYERAGGTMSAVGVLVDTWVREFESAWRDARVLTLTMHPEVIGRGYRFAGLQEVLAAMDGRARFSRVDDVAGRLSDVGVASAR